MIGSSKQVNSLKLGRELKYELDRATFRFYAKTGNKLVDPQILSEQKCGMHSKCHSFDPYYSLFFSACFYYGFNYHSTAHLLLNPSCSWLILTKSYLLILLNLLWLLRIFWKRSCNSVDWHHYEFMFAHLVTFNSEKMFLLLQNHIVVCLLLNLFALSHHRSFSLSSWTIYASFYYFDNTFLASSNF